jgi:hypothetical protein
LENFRYFAVCPGVRIWAGSDLGASVTTINSALQIMQSGDGCLEIDLLKCSDRYDDTDRTMNAAQRVQDYEASAHDS